LVIRTWSRDELSFALITGCSSWEMPQKLPEIQWSSVGGDRYDEFPEAIKVKEHLQACYLPVWEMANYVSKTLIARQSAVEVLLGEGGSKL